MQRHLKGFTFYRNAEGAAGGGDGTAASAAAAPAAAPITAGIAATASQEGSSASASVPMGGQPPAASAAPDFKTSLGEFASDPALADFKDPAALAKSYLETKKLVGQKLGIPGADATPEAKAAFEKALGVPDAPEGYEFKKPDSLPEGMEYNEEDAKQWAGKMKELGIPKDKANALRDEFIKQQVEGFKKVDGEYKADASKTDEGFDKAATRVFGDKKEAAMQNSRVMLEKYVSAETREIIKDVPNEHLVAFAEFASNFSKEMTGEDMVISSNNGGSAQSEGDLRTELRGIMATPEYSNPFVKGKEAHEVAKTKATEISNRIAKLQEANARRKN